MQASNLTPMSLSNTHTKSLDMLPDRRFQWLAMLGASACVAMPLYLADPSKAGFFPRCPIHALTGLYCAGCGTTRALHALLHCNMSAAIRFNPLSVLLLPVLSYYFLSFTREVFRTKPLPDPLGARRSIRLLIGLVVAFSIMRNIRTYPFVLLAPHESDSGRLGA